MLPLSCVLHTDDDEMKKKPTFRTRRKIVVSQKQPSNSQGKSASRWPVFSGQATKEKKREKKNVCRKKTPPTEEQSRLTNTEPRTSLKEPSLDSGRATALEQTPEQQTQNRPHQTEQKKNSFTGFLGANVRTNP